MFYLVTKSISNQLGKYTPKHLKEFMKNLRLINLYSSHINFITDFYDLQSKTPPI